MVENHAEKESVAYWRTLAIERQRELETLRERFLGLIDGISDKHARALFDMLDDSRAPWLRTLDELTTTSIVDPDDVTVVLTDLWRRVAADASSATRR
ncbi:MAG TPA: hypothetical protein VGQ76_22310 [Thermoanaerobaculia bacterium]|jgi:hypothetical protein|nr:hypothetical protein [Thermoanaerobaculia bacterium]